MNFNKATISLLDHDRFLFTLRYPFGRCLFCFRCTASFSPMPTFRKPHIREEHTRLERLPRRFFFAFFFAYYYSPTELSISV